VIRAGNIKAEQAATPREHTEYAARTDSISSGRAYPQGREARGPAGGAGVEVRAGHQPPDRQDARAHRAADAARSRRRGDRMNGALW
jgi:hypothetical protein